MSQEILDLRLITLARLNIAYSIAQGVVNLERCYPLRTKLESLSPGLMSKEMSPRRSQGGIVTSVSLLCLPKRGWKIS